MLLTKKQESGLTEHVISFCNFHVISLWFIFVKSDLFSTHILMKYHFKPSCDLFQKTFIFFFILNITHVALICCFVFTVRNASSNKIINHHVFVDSHHIIYFLSVPFLQYSMSVKQHSPAAYCEAGQQRYVSFVVHLLIYFVSSFKSSDFNSFFASH